MSTYASFKTFLIVESDMESQAGQSFQLKPSTPAQMADADQVAADGTADAMDGEQRVSLDPTALDQDERFLQLPQQEQERLKQMSQQVAPQELEDDLQRTWEANFGDNGSNANNPISPNPMGESLLQQLLNK